MERKLSILIYDCVTGIGSALKTDDHIRLIGQSIGDLALSFVSPVRSYNCFYHSRSSLFFVCIGNMQTIQQIHFHAPRSGHRKQIHFHAPKPGHHNMFKYGSSVRAFLMRGGPVFVSSILVPYVRR